MTRLKEKESKDGLALMVFVLNLSTIIIAQGFKEHYKYDHNIYSYIYYALYIKSKCPQEFNAVEKYVDDMVSLII